MERELRVAAWLRDHRVPAVRPLDGSGVLDLVTCRATVWHQVPTTGNGSSDDLGAALKLLHRVPSAPRELGLARLDPLEGVEDYLAGAWRIDQSDLNFMATQACELREAFSSLAPVLPTGVVHGDAHRKNVARTDQGPVLMDLERVCVGPREWDLVVAAVYRRLGWYSSGQYDRFVGAYGFDVREWEGFEVLSRMRLVRMAAWLCARTDREPRLLPEARLRIASLRRPEGFLGWTPGV